MLLLYNTSLSRLPDNCLTELTALTSLSTYFSRITKLQDGVFDGLHKLRKLWLDKKDITELQDGIFDELRMLEILDVSNNRISSIGLHAFDGLSKLKGLYLQANHITQLYDGIFNRLSMLLILDVSDNRISSIEPRAFVGPNKLFSLNLKANHITQLRDGIFDGFHMIRTMDVSNNRISSIGSRVFGGSAMAYSLSYVNLYYNRIETLDSWPMYTGIYQTVRIELRDNNIHSFTNNLRWKKNCGMREVHFDLLLERNPIMISIPDLLRRWDINISSTWCKREPKLYQDAEIINYVYFHCGCVDLIFFSLQMSLNIYNIHGVVCNNRSLCHGRVTVGSLVPRFLLLYILRFITLRRGWRL